VATQILRSRRSLRMSVAGTTRSGMEGWMATEILRSHRSLRMSVAELAGAGMEG
jgi:hypothetical protein